MKIKKCQPGYICVDNAAFLICSVAIIGGMYYLYAKSNETAKSNAPNKNTNVNVDVDINRETGGFGSYFASWFPSYPYNNLPPPLVTDPLVNPYNPPYRDERYFVGPVASIRPAIPPAVVPGVVPINVSTTAVDTAYRQIGILTPLNEPSKDNVLPLMGRPLYTRRSKWQYYAISNQHNNVKLPLIVKQKNALDEYGVDELYSGDTVLVEGTDRTYKVTKYENSTIKYLPFV